MREPQAILIAGPTASGKSGLAVDVAQAVGGVVINADSMQVYRDLNVLSARPQAHEMGGIRHELYGFVGAGDAYSVGRYVLDATTHIEAAHQRGQVPVIVGGTGLYFRGLLEGLSPVPAIDPDIRAHWREVAENLGPQHLFLALKARDPEMARRLNPTNCATFDAGTGGDGKHGAVAQLLADDTRYTGARAKSDVSKLSSRLSGRHFMRVAMQRFTQMIENGALFEVSRLQAMQLDRSFPVMGALGVHAFARVY